MSKSPTLKLAQQVRGDSESYMRTMRFDQGERELRNLIDQRSAAFRCLASTSRLADIQEKDDTVSNRTPLMGNNVKTVRR